MNLISQRKHPNDLGLLIPGVGVFIAPSPECPIGHSTPELSVSQTLSPEVHCSPDFEHQMSNVLPEVNCSLN